jgi:hypothetical protein
VLARLDEQQIAAVKARAQAVVARSFDDPRGFSCFYEVVFGRPLPRHALEEWIKPAYKAYKPYKISLGERSPGAGRGLLVEAFRGSTKTTTITIAFVAFRIGREPHASNLIVQVSDGLAADTAAQIADLIAHNPGWKLVFPHVVPDYRAGWGAGGYDVRNLKMDYAEWRRLCLQEKGKDPTFIGLGYKSRAIIGRHPTGMLVLDDIHDENNTRSARELAVVKKIVTGTVLPTAVPQTWKIAIGTPWARDDVLAYLKSTGSFEFVRTPIIRDGQLAWPEKFPREEIELQRRLAGEIEFARMFLLDLDAASGVHLKREWLHPYPHEKISPQWPVVMGVDYASAADAVHGSRRDYFAAAIGRVIPGGGGVVLADGFRGHVSQGEAEQRLKALASLYPTLQLIGVEAVGKGEEFYHLLLRTSLLPLMPLTTGGRTKGARFERGMAPLFQFSRAWISDVETPFLRAFRDEWARWPHGEHDDTLDAVYWMLYVARSHLLGAPPRANPAKQSNPFGGLGRE